MTTRAQFAAATAPDLRVSRLEVAGIEHIDLWCVHSPQLDGVAGSQVAVRTFLDEQAAVDFLNAEVEEAWLCRP